MFCPLCNCTCTRMHLCAHVHLHSTHNCFFEVGSVPSEYSWSCPYHDRSQLQLSRPLQKGEAWPEAHAAITALSKFLQHNFASSSTALAAVLNALKTASGISSFTAGADGLCQQMVNFYAKFAILQHCWLLFPINCYFFPLFQQSQPHTSCWGER